MGGGFQFRELLQDYKIRLVALTVQLFKNMVKIAQGLVVVNAEEKFQFFHNASTAKFGWRGNYNINSTFYAKVILKIKAVGLF